MIMILRLYFKEKRTKSYACYMVAGSNVYLSFCKLQCRIPSDHAFPNTSKYIRPQVPPQI